MPRKNSAPKSVYSFRLSLESASQIKTLAGSMGRSESDVIEIAVDRMYREEVRFGALSIREGQNTESQYDTNTSTGEKEDK
jgi:hypothetical protein